MPKKAGKGNKPKLVRLTEELEERIRRVMKEEGADYFSNFIIRGVTNYVRQREDDLGINEPKKSEEDEKKK
jgi:hypothetical protein